MRLSEKEVSPILQLTEGKARSMTPPVNRRVVFNTSSLQQHLFSAKILVNEGAI